MKFSKKDKEVLLYFGVLSIPYIAALFFESYFPTYSRFLKENIFWLPLVLTITSVLIIIIIQLYLERRHDRKITELRKMEIEKELLLEAKKKLETLIEMKKDGRMN
jgi:hypothetical protein